MEKTDSVIDNKMKVNEEDPEEILVLVELAGIIGSDFSDKINEKKYKILGIDSDNPIIQIGDNVFSGEFKVPLGTITIFEEKPEESNADHKQLELKHVVTKKLRMKRTFVNENSQSSSGICSE